MQEVTEKRFNWPQFSLRSGLPHVLPSLEEPDGPWGWRNLNQGERQEQLDFLAKTMNYASARNVGDLHRQLTSAIDGLTALAATLEANTSHALQYVCVDVFSQIPTTTICKSKLIERLIAWVCLCAYIIMVPC